MMDAVVDVLSGAFSLFLNAVSSLFDLLFFWLPDDFIEPYLEDMYTVAAANWKAFLWLNWFVDVPFFVAVFGMAVAALMAWTGFKVIDYIYRKAVRAIDAAKP